MSDNEKKFTPESEMILQGPRQRTLADIADPDRLFSAKELLHLAQAHMSANAEAGIEPRREDTQALITWAAYIRAAAYMIDNVLAGKYIPSYVEGDGEPVFHITEKGEREMRRIITDLKKAFE